MSALKMHSLRNNRLQKIQTLVQQCNHEQERTACTVILAEDSWWCTVAVDPCIREPISHGPCTCSPTWSHLPSFSHCSLPRLLHQQKAKKGHRERSSVDSTWSKCGQEKSGSPLDDGHRRESSTRPVCGEHTVPPPPRASSIKKQKSGGWKKSTTAVAVNRKKD
jgi:hypothetical protein